MMRFFFQLRKRSAALGIIAVSIYGCGLVTELPPAAEEGSGGRGSQAGSTSSSGGSSGSAHDDGGSSGGTGGSERDASSSGGTDGGVGTGGNVGTDGAAPVDAGTGGSPIIEASACMNPCDCDEDGALNASCIEDDTPPDCDDLDPRVFPGQTEYYTDESPNVGFDYNCDGEWTPRWTDAKCVILQPVLCPTQGERWINSVPPCGAPGAWGYCNSLIIGVDCNAVVVDEDRLQACN